jgi:hypothetical protein
MKLKCLKHNLRVMTFDGVVVHRGDGSHCKGKNLKIGVQEIRVTSEGLIKLAVGLSAVSPKARRGYNYY